jgi:opacity protein-like surface antigen
MKRTLFVVVALVAFATAASAASLSVVSDKTTYNVGETITLTVTGDDTGGSTSYGIFGRLALRWSTREQRHALAGRCGHGLGEGQPRAGRHRLARGDLQRGVSTS